MRRLTAFLRDRRQRVVCQQTFSNSQPIVFLLYKNYLPARLKSTVKLFADDTKIHRTISSEEDAAKLQHELNMLEAWSDTLHMNFNADKCLSYRRKGDQTMCTH